MTLEAAIALAVEQHKNMVDTAGQPYILHPLRVMLAVSGDELAMTAAVLHDVVEHTPFTLEELRRRGFPSEVVEAVDALTRRAGETYDAFVLRAKANPIARKVKLADLRDNMDLSRLTSVTADDIARFEQYLTALRALQNQRD
ncbi:MAG: HD domain-containing protein [Betaproteobacteria bacterium]